VLIARARRALHQLRDLAVLLVGLLPSGPPKLALLRLLAGWEIGARAVVRPTVLWRVRGARLGPDSYIGLANVMANIAHLEIGEAAIIGKLNWITAAWQLAGSNPSAGSLRLGDHAALVGPHAVDCSGGVRIGDFASLGGRGSVVLTHQVDYVVNTQGTAAVELGERCLVSARVNLTPGSLVPPRSLVAMGSTVLPGLTEPGQLYAGVPARAKRAVSGAHFDRRTGYVD
jgi:acetyltransferase-like isoleucine patch superfamily enzyme